jgi:hypothetical protein
VTPARQGSTSPGRKTDQEYIIAVKSTAIGRWRPMSGRLANREFAPHCRKLIAKSERPSIFDWSPNEQATLIGGHFQCNTCFIRYKLHYSQMLAIGSERQSPD